jgi:hypothetical protein
MKYYSALHNCVLKSSAAINPCPPSYHGYYDTALILPLEVKGNADPMLWWTMSDETCRQWDQAQLPRLSSAIFALTEIE